jgi:hypothetical protein
MESMQPNYLSRFGVVSGTGTDRRIVPEAELWTAVILQAIDDLDRRTSLTPRSAQDSAREWFASESDAVGSFIWTCHVINVDPNFIRSQLAKKNRMKNPDEDAVTPKVQGVKVSQERGLPTLTGQRGSRPSRGEAFKRVVVRL